MAGITRRETEVLEELMQGELFHQQVVSNQEPDRRPSFEGEHINGSDGSEQCDIHLNEEPEASVQEDELLKQLEELMRDELFTLPDQSEATSRKIAVDGIVQLLPKYEIQLRIPYVYKPLVGNNTIRLLCLQPGGQDEVLRGSIQHVLLNKNKGYEAVSYVWGPSERPSSLLLEDGIMNITQSV